MIVSLSPAVSFSLMPDSFVNTQHALPQNITQFETPALPQPPFDQQTLTQGTKCFLTIMSTLPERHS